MEANKSYDEMFGFDGSEKNQETIIPTESLVDFYDHLFPPYHENAMLELMRNIKDNGLYTPLLVRKHQKMDGKFEILSGHNRAEACRRLEIKSVEVKIFPDTLTDDEARLIVIDTNLTQRSLDALKISERARIIEQWYKLIIAQGRRKDLEDEVNKVDSKTKDKPNAPFSLASAQISRYIRIHRDLSGGLKDVLDSGKLSIKAAIELSFLDEDAQEIVETAINDGAKISGVKATAIKNKAHDVELTKEMLDDILKTKTSEKEKKISVKLSDDLILKYFKDIPEDEIKDTLALALESYFKE